jgi:hypothetical protein
VSRPRIETAFGSDPVEKGSPVARQSELAARSELVDPQWQLQAVARAGERRSLPDRRIAPSAPAQGAPERRSGTERRVDDREPLVAAPLSGKGLVGVWRARRQRAHQPSPTQRAAIQAQLDRAFRAAVDDR